MGPVLERISGANVIRFSPIDVRHRHTGHCRQIVDGRLQGPAAGLAICHYEGENGFHLFGCDESWSCVTDTWHETIGEAMVQAELEYEGVTATWQQPAGQ